MSDLSRQERWRRIHRAIDRALQGETIPQPEHAEVAQFITDAVPAFTQAGLTTYLVFGSYRGEHEVRLRAMQYELSKPANAEATLIGDTRDPETTIIPSFLIKFHVLGEFADYLVGVYEKEDGGESPELGLLDRHSYFDKTWMFPRDYHGLTRDALKVKDDVIAAAIHIYFAPEESNEKKKRELEALLSEAQNADIDIVEEELVEILRMRKRDGLDKAAQYSWVHLNIFRLYELHERCFPWFSEAELRSRSTEVPGPPRPEWEDSVDIGDSL